MVDCVAPPTADRIPDTPLLRYFRKPPFFGPKGKGWGKQRIDTAQKLLDEPSYLAGLLDESAKIVEAKYRNYQPFYPVYHKFGTVKDRDHGDLLCATVDVAARFSKREIWDVPDNPRLSFRYLDREIELGRTKPSRKQKSAPKPPAGAGTALLLDLFLANANVNDRTPILCEMKLREDQCALYALVQLLTQAAYAATPSQRERLVLFGSKPWFVLREALPGELARLDLYILLVEKPEKEPWISIQPLAIELSQKLIAHPLVGSRIRRIAWIEAIDNDERTLTLTKSQFTASKFRLP